MDNVCEQLEEKTGGKVIFRRGGVLFLFRGRNYNYKTRPRFPLMLWKPVAPMYPRLIPRLPEGLMLEQATEMKKKGRKLMPICKLAKNGVYADLLRNVREVFEDCELVRINCQGIKGSDYRKIGAELKELVPCVLISFEEEHILMWSGKDWKLSFVKPAFNNVADATCITGQLEGQELSAASIQAATTGAPLISSPGISNQQRESSDENDRTNAALDAKPDEMEAIETTLDRIDYASDESESKGNTMRKTYSLEPILENSGITSEEPLAMPLESDVMSRCPESSLSNSETSVMNFLKS